jgi:hypothetical protein
VHSPPAIGYAVHNALRSSASSFMDSLLKSGHLYLSVRIGHPVVNATGAQFHFWAKAEHVLKRPRISPVG